MKFDELNQLKRFFSTMELTDDEKKKRCDLALLFYDAVYFTFALIKVESDLNSRNITQNELISRLNEYFERENESHSPAYVKELAGKMLDHTEINSDVAQKVINDLKTESFNVGGYRQTLEDRITDAFAREGIDYNPEYVDRLVSDILDTTSRHLDDPYYLSRDRALLIAQNESNSSYNFVDYEKARKDGKRYKTWITENDERVRLEHAEVDGARIPIDEMFTVGSDLMAYPHDYLNGSPGNLINCRCVCIYD